MARIPERDVLLSRWGDLSMLELAGVFLVATILVAAAAILCFSRSPVAAKWLMLFANVAACVAALAVVLAGELHGIGDWAFLFACGAFGCGVVAARKLGERSTRWVHRFVIYAGYAATFAAMGIIGLWLHENAASGKLAAAVLIGVYAAGSLCIFAAKTLTVRMARKTMPEYHASLGAEEREWG
jgi:hypothetical protein